MGGNTYAGDLSRGYDPLDSRFNVFGFYRMNFTEFLSFRTNLSYGSITGSDEDPIDPLGEVRNRSFKSSFFEFAGTFEYYFLDFRDRDALVKFSPYVFAGFGVSRFSESTDDFNRLQAIVPFGLGFTHLVGKRWAVSFEFGPRKTFTDLIDGVSGGEQTVKDFDFGQPNTNDWYFHTGVSIAYIIYKIPCPFPYIPNRAMLRR